MKQKEIFSFCLAVLVGLSFLAPVAAFAEDSAALTPDTGVVEGGYSERIADKLGRGIENVFVGWLEVPHQIVKTTKEKNVWQGASVGFGKGLFNTVERMGVGVYEVLTFPYPQKPIMPTTENWEW